MTDNEILDGLVRKATEFLEKARKAQERANGHAEDSDLPVPFPDLISTQATTGGRLQIRSDHFANHTAPSGAARAYLDMRAQQKLGAATPRDILEALQQGGFETTEGGLKVALGKDKAFRRLPNGSFGLWSWYPDAKRKDDKRDGENDDASRSDAASGEKESA